MFHTYLQVARYAEGVRRFDFDAGLAPYDLAACARWRDLSCFIDEQLLKKLLPVRHPSAHHALMI